MKNAYVKYIVALLLFGSNGIVASYILLNSYEIVYLRTLIGSIFLIIVFVLMKQKLQFWKNKLHLLYLMISGIAMGASWILLFEAYAQVGVSIAVLTYYCGPVIVMILSPFLFKEKMTSAKMIGFLAVIIGMFCLNWHDLISGKVTWGLILGILAAGMYALMVIFNKKAKSIIGLENATCQLVVSFLTVSTFIGFKQGFSVNVIEGNWIPILILGIVNTGIGCYFYFSSIGRLPVQSVSILGYLEPLSALVFSFIILGELLSPMQIVGAMLILGGAAYGELYRVNKHELKTE
ncbi:EamA family transporter [Butyricicoccus sp. 1XD8-22]|nr:EamA family transporter [Butyricicoccus sp. 1XD8-22]